MFLNVGGALLGVALPTVIKNSVVSVHGGDQQVSARFIGYKSAYYSAVALCGIAMLLSLFGVRKTRCYGLRNGSPESVDEKHDQYSGEVSIADAVERKSNEGSC